MGAVANGCSSEAVQALLNANPGSVRVRQGKHTLLHQAACHNQSADTVKTLLAAWPEAATETDDEVRLVSRNSRGPTSGCKRPAPTGVLEN